MIVIPYREQRVIYNEVGNRWAVKMSSTTVEFKSLLHAKHFIDEIITHEPEHRLEAIRKFEKDRQKKLLW